MSLLDHAFERSEDVYRGWGVTVQKFETEYIEDAELLVIDGAISLGRDSEGALLFREVVEERKDGSTTRIEYDGEE